VEDNVVNRKVMSATLKGLGLEVVDAENGSLALDALKHERVDLILMDMNMPVMDGIEATKCIRAAEASGELQGRMPIIAMTANVLKEAVDACREAGMDDFVPKPLQRSQTIDALARWLKPSASVASGSKLLRLDPAIDAAVDADYYRQVERTMGEEMGLLMADFTSSTAQLVGDISRAAAEHDWLTIKRCAHALRSSASTVGATRLAAMSADLEARACAERCSEFGQAAVALQIEFERAQQALDQLSESAGRMGRGAA